VGTKLLVQGGLASTQEGGRGSGASTLAKKKNSLHLSLPVPATIKRSPFSERETAAE